MQNSCAKIACIVPFKPYATSGADIWITTCNVFSKTTGIVLANNIPYSNEFVFDEDIVMEGSIYATGKSTPEAFSILVIPETTIGNRLTIREYSFSGKIPF